jgi:hypothetical protein
VGVHYEVPYLYIYIVSVCVYSAYNIYTYINFVDYLVYSICERDVARFQPWYY